MSNRGKCAAVERYLRRVRRELPIPGRTRRALLCRIREAIYEQIQEENPDRETLISKFGSPRQIAESYMDSLSVSEFMNEMRIRRKVVCIVSAAALAAFLLWGSIIGGIWLYHRTHESNFPVYYLDTVYLDGAEQGEK